MDLLNSVCYALLDWLSHGFSGFSGWEVVAYTLITTHITIAAVTIFLHRAQAHRALDLHPIPNLRQPALTGCPWHDVNEMLQAAGLRPTRQRMALGWLLFGKGARSITQHSFEPLVETAAIALERLCQGWGMVKTKSQDRQGHMDNPTTARKKNPLRFW